MADTVDFNILQKAGLSATDLYYIYCVIAARCKIKRASRMAVYNWTRGLNAPRGNSAAKLELLLAAIDAAVRNATLPIDIKTKRADRIAVILEAVLAEITLSDNPFDDELIVKPPS